jgi:hypothetical protein
MQTIKLEIFGSPQKIKLYETPSQRPAFAPGGTVREKKKRPGKFTGRRQQKQAAATISPRKIHQLARQQKQAATT